jgi:cell division initiation protein
MKLSPLDIQQQQFRRVMRGYSPAEVHQFLEVVSEQLFQASREQQEAQSALALCAQERDGLLAREEELKAAMMTAQRAVDELRGQASKEAQLVLEDAELRAEKILLHAQGKVSEMSETCQDLRRERVRFEEELRGLINTYARLLEVRPGEPGRTLSAPHATVTVLDRLRPPAPPTGDAESFAQTS